jgi:signal transduction histidine kinase
MTETTMSFGEILAERIQSEAPALSQRWLERLNRLLPVPPSAVFPTEELLDHIPSLLHEIGAYLRAPEEEEIAANVSVVEKAREMGLLRYRQRASVHQLLREYDILSGILEHFISAETERLALEPSPVICFEIGRRISRAIRILMQATVDTFVSEYIDRIEQQKSRLESFNQMLSHELRTPLSTLHFAANLLANEDFSQDPRSQERLVAAVRRNAERAVLLMRNVERLVGTESGAEDGPSQQLVHVAAVAREVARQLRTMADARQVEIRVAADLPFIFVDAGKLELALINLLSNAIKYSDPRKSVRYVEIRAVPPEATDACTICVEDNGLGIPADAIALVFDRFYRAHAELDGDLANDGTGLGLSIVQECARAMEGSVRVESVEGQGTAFYLTLPARPGTPPDLGEPA